MQKLITTNASGYTNTYTVRDSSHAERVIDRLQAAGKNITKVEIKKI